MTEKLCEDCLHFKESICEYNLGDLGPGLCSQWEPSGVNTPEETTTIMVSPDKDDSVVRLYQESCQLEEYANAREVKSVDDVKLVTDELAIIGKLKRSLEGKRKDYTAPINEHLKNFNAIFQRFTAPLVNAKEINDRKVSKYLADQEAKRLEQERINQLRMEAAQAEMELKGELTESVDLVEVQPEAPRLVRTDMGTLGTRNTWKAEVTDFALLPDEYKLPNMSMLNTAARGYKDQRTIPGVRIWNDRSIVVRPK